MYRDALGEMPLEEKVESVRAQEGYAEAEQPPAHLHTGRRGRRGQALYEHGGFDVISTARAVLANLRTGTLSEGGSTLTQQLAKNLYFTQEKSLPARPPSCSWPGP